MNRTKTTATLAALDLLAALPLENGARWGEMAHPFQLADARAIFDPEGPRRHFLLRGRGMSKTTDIAGITLSLLLTEAPANSTSLVYASDADQAELTMEALSGFVDRAGLRSRARVLGRTVENTATGATLTVETSDGASAFGKRPWLQIVDELAVWPNTPNHRTLWSAISSAVPKVPGSRLIIITTAGSPTGIGAKRWQKALTSPAWHTSLHPGPSPWWAEEDIAEVKDDLTPSEWRRLILCEWSEADDALTSPADIEAVIRPGDPVLAPDPRREYVAALDVGTRRDLTALAVGHAEERAAGRVFIIDKVMSWRPSDSGGRVDLAEVEAASLRVCREYGAKLRFDRMQAEQLTTNLQRQGVRTEEFVFSSAGANRLARSLWGALRDRSLSLPDDDETREEFMSARMVETGPSTVKLQNPPGTHDDLVVAVGMIVADLSQRPAALMGGISVPGRSVAPSDEHRLPTPHRSGEARRAVTPTGGIPPQAKRLTSAPRRVYAVAGMSRPNGYETGRRRS